MLRDLDTEKQLASANVPHGMSRAIAAANVPRDKLPPRAAEVLASPNSYKRGGRVRKSGWAKVHKGERITPKGRVAFVMGGKKRKNRKRRRVAKKTAT